MYILSPTSFLHFVQSVVVVVVVILHQLLSSASYITFGDVQKLMQRPKVVQTSFLVINKICAFYINSVNVQKLMV